MYSFHHFASVIVPLALATVVLGEESSPAQRETPAAQSATPVGAGQTLPGEMLAAAHAGDGDKVWELLHPDDEKQRDFAIHTGFETIAEALRLRDMPAFTTMYDLFRTSAFGNDWKVSDESLARLVKDGRTDFLDVLLARGLDLKRLSEQTDVADPATAAWIARRIVEVGKQRADIEPFCKAASDGDLPTIRRLLAQGVDVNCVGKDNNTPLIRTVFKNRLEAAQLLIDHGADVNKPRFPGCNYTPLCLVNSVPMAELLKKNGADINAKLFRRDVSILTYVVKFAKADVVEWFLNQGLDPKMVSDKDRSLLFFLDDARTAKLLLDAGVDPNLTNDYGEPPIASAGNAAVAQMLIDHGARLTGFEKPMLMMMVQYGSPGAMEAVLKAGADHDPATIQNTLTEVEWYGPENIQDKEKMRQLLLAQGAKPVPPSDLPPPETEYDITVSATNGAFLGDGETDLEFFQRNSYGYGTESYQVDSDGTVTIGLRNDTKTAGLAAVRKDWAPTLAGPFHAPFGDELKNLKLVLMQGFRAAVVIIDKAGRPIPGATLTGFYPGPPKIDCTGTVTDASGMGMVDHIGAAELNLMVTADGYQADEIDDIHLDPARPYRWTLEKAQVLSGTVTTETGQPIAGATIKLAGVRGPHNETHDDPASAPVLAVSDARGRFALTTLRADCSYFLFVSATGRGGQYLQDVKAGQSELKVALGPELTVSGKVIHISPSDLNQWQYHGQYIQSFKFDNGGAGTGQSITMNPKNGEADFTISSLYAWPVYLQIGDKEIKLEAKDLPKSGLIIDVAGATER